MAIQFETKPNENIWQKTENNLVFLFSSDNATDTPVYCDVTIAGSGSIRVFRRPDNKFYFNAVDYVRVFLSDYNDDLALTGLVSTDVNTYAKQWDKATLEKSINFSIFFNIDFVHYPRFKFVNVLGTS